MNYIPRHKKSIEIEFSTNNSILFRATFPSKEKHNISNWYKGTKNAVANANKIPVWKIKGKHKIIDAKTFDRILFEWPGGISIDLPDDVTGFDYKIILHYLEGVKMSLS